MSLQSVTYIYLSLRTLYREVLNMALTLIKQINAYIK
ncbi:hypothetical protein NTGBS_580023 [Candidatus Nitrotoga sp. BS]|nr:hypothetical protein NTGBS_580023 [Candidatus Nitrotoga sp. BS]